MIESIRIRGFKAGLKAGKEARDRNIPPKNIIKSLSVDDRIIAKQLMEEFKAFNVRWKKCFKLGVAYSLGYDDGVLKAAYD